MVEEGADLREQKATDRYNNNNLNKSNNNN